MAEEDDLVLLSEERGTELANPCWIILESISVIKYNQGIFVRWRTVMKLLNFSGLICEIFITSSFSENV